MSLAVLLEAQAATHRVSFQADLLKPGETEVKDLHRLLGKPRRIVREGGGEYYFYDLGTGSSADATIRVKHGVVEYVSYLCRESLKDIRQKYGNEKPLSRDVASTRLSQLLYEQSGKGFVFDPHTHKVRACLSWAPGRKFEELGR